MTGLTERLRAEKTQHRVTGLFGGAISIADENETRQVPINPDGPEAADMIEKLMGALTLIAAMPYAGAPDIEMRRLAREALGLTQ